MREKTFILDPGFGSFQNQNLGATVSCIMMDKQGQWAFPCCFHGFHQLVFHDLWWLPEKTLVSLISWVKWKLLSQFSVSIPTVSYCESSVVPIYLLVNSFPKWNYEYSSKGFSPNGPGEFRRIFWRLKEKKDKYYHKNVRYYLKRISGE